MTRRENANVLCIVSTVSDDLKFWDYGLAYNPGKNLSSVLN